MGLDITFGRIREYEVCEHDYLIANEEDTELIFFFKDFLRAKHFKYPNEEYEMEVLYFEEIYHQYGGVLISLYESIKNDSVLTKTSDIERLLKHINPNQKHIFHSNIIEKFVEGTDFLIISW
jgi:hypothetical protein